MMIASVSLCFFVLTVSGASPAIETPAEGACSEHQRPLESILLQTSKASLGQRVVKEKEEKSEVVFDDDSGDENDAVKNPVEEERLSSNGTVSFLSEASKRGAKQASGDHTARDNACCQDAYMFGWETAKLARDVQSRKVSYWDMMERFDEAMVYRYGYGAAKRAAEYAAAGLSTPTLAQQLGKKAADGGEDYKDRKKELKACNGYLNMKSTAHNGAMKRDELPPTEPVTYEFKVAAYKMAKEFCQNSLGSTREEDETMCRYYWCPDIFLFGYHLQSLAHSAYQGTSYETLMDTSDWVSKFARGAISYRTDKGKASAKKRQKNACGDTSTLTAAVQQGALKIQKEYDPESAFAPYPAYGDACGH